MNFNIFDNNPYKDDENFPLNITIGANNLEI